MDSVEVDRENEEKGRDMKSIQPLIQKRHIRDGMAVSVQVQLSGHGRMVMRPSLPLITNPGGLHEPHQRAGT